MQLNQSDNDSIIRKLEKIVLANLENENFGVEELIREAGISEFTIRRKLKTVEGKTINQFILGIRLCKAMELLQQGDLTASEVAFRTGFSSASYFNKCFHDFYGFSPGEAKKRKQNGKLPEDIANQPIQKAGEKGKSKIWIWLTVLTCLVVVLILINLVFFPFISGKSSTRNRDTEKSIAVLPFTNDSPDSSNVWLINGITEAINDNLSKIADLMVVSRTSAEQYRGIRSKSIREIARELNVRYIIEGSGQKIGDQILLSVQLIDAKTDRHLLSERYNRKLEDIFELYNDVAIHVAQNIEAKITGTERERIQKAQTRDSLAYRMCQMALNWHRSAVFEHNRSLEVKAEGYYKAAIRLDTAYAAAYFNWAWAIYRRDPDSAILLAQKAIHFDPDFPDPYAFIGYHYLSKGRKSEAVQAYKTALKLDPNNVAAIRFLGTVKFEEGSCSEGIRYLLKSIRLKYDFRNALIDLSFALFFMGFEQQGVLFADKILSQDNDSIGYFDCLTWGFQINGKFEEALKYAMKGYSLDTARVIPYQVNLFMLMRDYSRMLVFMQKCTETARHRNYSWNLDYYSAFVCTRTGLNDEADYWFKESLRKINDYPSIADYLRGGYSLAPPFIKTCIYSATGEKGKAMENFRLFTQYPANDLYILTTLKFLPILDFIRQEPEFQEHLRKVEARYLKERVKVEKLLKEEGLL